MSIRARKDVAREFLEKRDLDGIVRWSETVRNPLRILFSITFDSNELIRWRAVEAVGKVAAHVAGDDLDRVRDFIRRLLWLMNDESGGLSWMSPELIGEILVNVPILIDEYGPLLPSFFKEEPFQRGAHQAVFRVARAKPKLFKDCLADLTESLADSDATVRGLAVLALGAISIEAARGRVEGLQFDNARVTLYNFASGQIREMTVGQLAQSVLGLNGTSEWAA